MDKKHPPFWAQPGFDPWASCSAQPWWRKPVLNALPSWYVK